MVTPQTISSTENSSGNAAKPVSVGGNETRCRGQINDPLPSLATCGAAAAELRHAECLTQKSYQGDQ